MNPFDPPLDTARHLRYWQRCLRTLLPHHYTSMDSTRLSLGFFILCSIDLLTPPNTESKPLLTPADRLALRQWVLSTQHPNGGFCGSPTHVVPAHHQTSANANLAATYFALLLLAILADSDAAADAAFAPIDRTKTLLWLRRLQRASDGSFGEVVDDNDVVAGGRDMRYCYLAAAIRWMLRGPEESAADIPDIDVPALVAHIRRGQTYDGGFAESYRHESHTGYAYCAVAALALLDRPPSSQLENSNKAVHLGIADRERFISFLVSRSFAYNADAEDDDDEDDDDDTIQAANLSNLSLSEIPTTTTATEFIGFNGRCNKTADTCYTWWTLGALSILSFTPDDAAAVHAQRRFLLEQTQHLIGGFGKHPGAPPDVGHACLGLAALATMGDPALKPFDATLCVSRETVAKVERARRGLLLMVKKEEKSRSDLGARLVGVAVRLGGGTKPEWLLDQC